jgi:hypothetical protein
MGDTFVDTGTRPYYPGPQPGLGLMLMLRPWICGHRLCDEGEGVSPSKENEAERALMFPVSPDRMLGRSPLTNRTASTIFEGQGLTAIAP